MIYALIVIFLIGVDQMTKYLVNAYFTFGQRYPVISDFFYLTNISNKGAAWGILDDAPWILFVFFIIAFVILIFIFVNDKRFAVRLPLSLIIGGAIGNFIDRVFREAGVVDFLEFHFGDYVFPVFNFADMCITIGAFFLLLVMIFANRNDPDLDNLDRTEGVDNNYFDDDINDIDDIANDDDDYDENEENYEDNNY